VQLTRILDSLLNIENLPDPDKLESIFIFATVWGLGACLSNDSKKIFEDKLRSLVEKPMPDKKISLFDFYFDMKREWVNWKDEVRPYDTPEGIKYSKILVPTVDTKKYSYILDLMVKNKFPCIFVGESGTAKSVIISNYLGSLSQDLYMKLEINFSSRTTSKDLQANL
jgi:dynein heavy chain, axonemal